MGTMTERLPGSSYQAFVDHDFKILLDRSKVARFLLNETIFDSSEAYDPTGRYAPVWTKSFDEKAILPENTRRFRTEMNNESEMIRLKIPRQYIRQIIEVEMFKDNRNEDTVVERIYYGYPNGKKDLRAISACFKDPSPFSGGRLKLRWASSSNWIPLFQTTLGKGYTAPEYFGSRKERWMNSPSAKRMA